MNIQGPCFQHNNGDKRAKTVIVRFFDRQIGGVRIERALEINEIQMLHQWANKTVIRLGPHRIDR